MYGFAIFLWFVVFPVFIAGVMVFKTNSLWWWGLAPALVGVGIWIGWNGASQSEGRDAIEKGRKGI